MRLTALMLCYHARSNPAFNYSHVKSNPAPDTTSAWRGITRPYVTCSAMHGVDQAQAGKEDSAMQPVQ